MIQTKTYEYIKDHENEFEPTMREAQKHVADFIGSAKDVYPNLLNVITKEVEKRMIRTEFYTLLLQNGMMERPETCGGCPFCEVTINLSEVCYSCLQGSQYYDSDFAFNGSKYNNDRPKWCPSGKIMKKGR